MHKRILEIGPGQMPSHHQGGIHLEQGDTYTAVDQSMRVFGSEIWEILQDTYGDQLHLMAGDRENLPDGEYDEIISLGSWGSSVKRIIEQAGQILKPGGNLYLVLAGA